MATLGVGEIFAIVSLVTNVVAAAERVTKLWGSVEQAPKDLRRLHQDIKQVEVNAKELQEVIKGPGNTNNPVNINIQRIEDTLKEGQTLYKDCESTLKGPWGSIVWTMMSSRRVSEYRSELQNLHHILFTPAWHQLI